MPIGRDSAKNGSLFNPSIGYFFGLHDGVILSNIRLQCRYGTILRAVFRPCPEGISEFSRHGSNLCPDVFGPQEVYSDSKMERYAVATWIPPSGVDEMARRLPTISFLNVGRILRICHGVMVSRCPSQLLITQRLY